MDTATKLEVDSNTIGEYGFEENFSYLSSAETDTAEDLAHKLKTMVSTGVAYESRRKLRTKPLLKPISFQPFVEQIKQKWNGVVLQYDENEITARLEDLTAPDQSDEVVVLPMDEIEDRDRALISKGAMFLWQIGYRQGARYPRERFSKISFRRLPKWSKAEIEEADSLGKEYEKFFITDSSHSS